MDMETAPTPGPISGPIPTSDPVPAPDLIPAPVRVGGEGRRGFLFGPSTTITAAPGTENTERWLRTTLGAAFGLPLAPGGEHATDTVRLGIDPALEPEGYRLSTGTGGSVEITGGSPAGVFWGAQTLRQLLGPEAFRRAPVSPGTQRAIPFADIEDAPRFPWRGMMLDVARHFLPKDDVLRYLDLLAAHKLNVFHFHLTDDQGWRIEIKRFPRLTEVGSWRSRTKHGHRASELWDETPHGGYYTQDDIREIVAYAAERHIRVVPEIDIPGHSQAAIAAYPELGNADVVDTTALSVWDTWGINANVLAPTDNTLRFFEGVLEEVLDLFPAATSPFIHIGGDECRKDQWKESPVAQARIDEFGLANEDELQSWIIRHFDTWLTARGRRLIGWDEILEGGLPVGAAVSSWRGYGGGIAAAEAGHDVVMCPEQHVYLDHRQDGGPDEPMPIGFVRTLEDVYRFEPVPAGLSEEAARHILGTQANVWTEVMQNRARVDYQVFPRLAAFAEVAWSPLPASAERDFAAFERRMTTHYARLDALGVDYRPPAGPLPRQQRPGVLGRPIDGVPPNV
ncbi:beta-N-acetylhexosaminidase [Streptomyces sp. NBC_00825]|uniref:beta-N-acetylhexosaminidase n=1 Tax=unclassified Streptomyces TaxID=2593676 RepID=UPI002257ED1F|nr:MULTISPECIES: beta-N-acetylhexosaminidase [unclassified Streptomyces]WTB54624.1 beta-N-acetylhexosaminidase [Streptomyces sp. NBC_00826]WTH92489.1 beta-N-acetylhexosaminidase [Streptomyces sp. NBC_00825]WTI01220.1 beta-N-acetylhexosaminidase [Streptomyces sp. NBC_00822]MCX4866803.1 beta-N-acetylhexosaminidase [Streptomyces sp. NBC_00906]MCX4898041.1 beta-N-acetylhexosaminidase [Streptomyces sp. NBC_00892]